MDNVSVQAELLHAIYYTNKSGKPMTWLQYRLLEKDYLVNTDKMVGYSIIDEYIYNQDCKSKLKPEHFGAGCIITYGTKSSANPLRNKKYITSIKFGDKEVVNLV